MNIRLSAHGFELTSEFDKYANAKVALLGRQLPKAIRQTASCRLHFTQTQQGGTKFNTCSLTLELDGTELKAKETTVHMYAALDIATVHMQHQLKNYLELQHKHRLRSRLAHPFRPRPRK